MRVSKRTKRAVDKRTSNKVLRYILCTPSLKAPFGTRAPDTQQARLSFVYHCFCCRFILPNKADSFFNASNNTNAVSDIFEFCRCHRRQNQNFPDCRDGQNLEIIRYCIYCRVVFGRRDRNRRFVCFRRNVVIRRCR